MRFLTDFELLLVAGGNNSSDITVCGNCDDDWPPLDNDPQDGDDGGGGGSGGNGDPSPPEDPTFHDLDCAVNAAKSAVAGTSDHNSKEHYVITYEDASGGLHNTPVFVGSGSQSSLTQALNWLTTNGIGYSQIIDLYHNHDSSEYGFSTDSTTVNAFPSTRFTSANGRGDWGAADDLIARGVDPSRFTMTIEDPDGVARDFAYSDKGKYGNMTQDDMLSKTPPPAVQPCH